MDNQVSRRLPIRDLKSSKHRSHFPWHLEILTNRDAVSINQDIEAPQAKRVSFARSLDVSVKKLSVGWAIAIINRSDQIAIRTVNGDDLGPVAAQAYEVWTKQTVAFPYSFTIPAHGCVLLKTL